MPSNIRGRLTKLEVLAMGQGMNGGPLPHLSHKALNRELLALLHKGCYQGDTLPPQAVLDEIREALKADLNRDQPTRAKKQPTGPLPPCAGVVVDIPEHDGEDPREVLR